MESRGKNVSILIGLHQDMKMVKNVVLTTMDILFKKNINITSFVV